jgi:hypothetical protein
MILLLGNKYHTALLKYFIIIVHCKIYNQDLQLKHKGLLYLLNIYGY